MLLRGPTRGVTASLAGLGAVLLTLGVTGTAAGPLAPPALAAGAAPTAGAAAAPLPTHTLSVAGAGVGSYPAFDPAIERYAVTTTAATAGTLTVQATTSDPGGVVRVDGQVAPGGTATVSGLSVGDEVSVFIEDSAGTEVHSLVYLPVGFPALEVVATSPGVEPGQLGMVLRDFRSGPLAAAVLDRNGVPVHVQTVDSGIDLKQQPDGRISMAVATTTPGRTGSAIEVLDDQWHEVDRYQTVGGLTDTDLHDSILLPDGTRWLVAYEPNPVTGKTDAVIQHASAAGAELFRWSSADLAGETVWSANPDYAHINSIALAPDGDIIASFRHLSAVLKIATSARPGVAEGDVVWKLGGRDSSFDFVDDPLGGPCAQHTATMLPNGHVLVFDDGSDHFLSTELCVDQSDPTGPAVERLPWQSRAAEYALDTEAGTATLVWDYTPPGRYSWFMGSAQRLGNGDTLIGWAAAVQALASEVDADGTLVWELRLAPVPDPQPFPQWSYRVSLMNVPDAFAPELEATAPAEGAVLPVGQVARADFSCTDLGGSSLQTCGGDVRPGGTLDTSTPGLHTVRLTATDGAGNATSVVRHYTVTATYQPAWDRGRVRASLRGTRVAAKVRLTNAGSYDDAFTLRATRSTHAWGVHYKIGHEDVTDSVRTGSFRTDLLAPGRSLVLRVVVSRTDRTRVGTRRTFTVRAVSAADTTRSATMDVVVRASAVE